MIKKIISSLTVFILLGFFLPPDGPYNNLPNFNPDANVSRDKIPSVYKWDLTDICEDLNKWNLDLNKCKKDLTTLKELQKDLTTNEGQEVMNHILTWTIE